MLISVLILLIIFFIFYIVVCDIGIRFQKEYLFSDAYELMSTYSINTNVRIKYKYTCFLCSGKHFLCSRKHGNTYTCKFGVSSDYIYIKFAQQQPYFFTKPLRLQIPKKDLVFLQREKLSSVFLAFADSCFCKNDYDRYNIANSTVSVLFPLSLSRSLSRNI
jgi:hypothetical protein